MSGINIPGRAWALIFATIASGSLGLLLTFPTDRLIGRMFEAEGQLDLAIAYLDAWNEAHPADFESRWHAVELHLSNVGPDEAIATLEAMALERPDDPRVLEKLVDIERSLLREERTLVRLEALAKLRPDDASLMQKIADYHRWLGHGAALKATLQRLLALDPTADEREELVQILIDEGDDETAMRLLHEMLEREPTNFEHVERLVNRLVDLDRYPDAIALLERYLTSRPSDAAAAAELTSMYETQAERLAQRGQRDAAVALFSKRLAQDPTSLSLRLSYAALFGKDATRVAVEQLESLTDLTPKSAAAWYALGERYSWSRRAGDAISAFEKAVDLAPTKASRRRTLARHLSWAGRNTEAIVHYTALIEAGGTTLDRIELVERLLSSEQPRAALDRARDLYDERPTHARIRRLMLRAALASERCDIAIALLRSRTEQRPKDARAWGQLGLCAKQLGLTDEALAALTQARRLRARGR